MSKLRFLLVVVAAFAVTLSFAVPAEDIPETPYDESEALPYESTLSFSVILEESAQAQQSVPTFVSLPRVNPTPTRDEIPAAQSGPTPRPISSSVTILDHALRC